MSADPRVLALRAELQRTFAAPRDAPGDGRPEDLLLLRVGDEALAVRAAETMGLERRRKVVRLPGAGGPLLGLAAVRGKLMAAWSLTRLLGAADDDEARWLLVCEREVALAFSTFEGMRRVPGSDVTLPGSEGGTALVRVDGALRRVLSIPAVLGSIPGAGAADGGTT